ncbi:MAG: hypothetical protein KIT68_01740 [Phycisphaeraceae bacterium]|nr:hypothetical protein [Phycisphaeraceae bacterium]
MDVGVRLIFLAGLTLPAWALLCIVAARRWPGLTASERALAGALLLALLVLAEVGCLGYLPAAIVARPLDLLPWLHVAVVAGLAWIALRRTGAVPPAAPPAGAATQIGASLAVRPLVLLAAAWYAVLGFYAAWNVDWLADATLYHVPQVLQPWQDGRLGPVHASVVWADSYPRAASLLKFWAMRVSGTDAAINIVSWWWGGVFMLAVCVAGRRLGMARTAGLLAAALVPTAPIFGLLTGIGYADLDVSACVAACLAFAVPRAGEDWSRSALAPCLAGGVLALWMKFSACLVVGLVLAFRLAIAGRGSRQPLGRFALLAGVAVLAAACPYLVTWMRYGSPVWPIRLEVVGWTIFDGPHPMGTLTPGHAEVVQRFAQQWTGWFAELTPDSFGNQGPLFGVLLAPAMLAGVAAAVVTRSAGWLLMALAVLSVFVGPQMHAGRYGLHVLMPASLFACWLGVSVPDRAWRTGLAALVGLLMLGNIALLARGLVQQQERLHAATEPHGQSPWTSRRNGVWLDSSAGPEPRWPGAEARAAARESTPDGGLLISAVHGATTLLHNARYTYRVEHRPAAAWPIDLDKTRSPAFGSESIGAWVRMLRELGADTVLVYAGSCEDDALRTLGSGFALCHQDRSAAPTSVRVYRRSPPDGAASP